MWPRVKYGLTEVCGWSRTGLDKSCDHWPSSYKSYGYSGLVVSVLKAAAEPCRMLAINHI